MNKKHGFTLIELLVVIAIISLLVSILLPSLQKAKELARSVVCQSDLHGYGLILAMFTNEYNGRFPQHISSGSGLDGNDHKWYHWAPTLHRAGFTELPGRALCKDMDLPLKLYRGCSDDSVTQPEPPATNTSHFYMYNADLWKLATVDRIRDAYGVVAWSDGYRDAGSGSYGLGFDSDAYSTYPNIGNWHMGGANLIFTDGHVEHREKNEDTMTYDMWRPYEGTGSTAHIIPGWVNFPVDGGVTYEGN